MTMQQTWIFICQELCKFITYINAENFLMGGHGHKIVKNTFNFRDCNIGLQRNLNELAQLLTPYIKPPALPVRCK